MHVRYIALIILLAPWASCADSAFTSQDDFSKWLTFYYQNPEPDRIPAAVRYMSESGVLNNQNAFSPVFGFLAGVIRENPNKADMWAHELRSLDPAHYGVVILGIWYAKLPNSQEVVYGILDSDEILKEQFSYLKTGK